MVCIKVPGISASVAGFQKRTQCSPFFGFLSVTTACQPCSTATLDTTQPTGGLPTTPSSKPGLVTTGFAASTSALQVIGMKRLDTTLPKTRERRKEQSLQKPATSGRQCWTR